MVLPSTCWCAGVRVVGRHEREADGGLPVEQAVRVQGGLPRVRVLGGRLHHEVVRVGGPVQIFPVFEWKYIEM